MNAFVALVLAFAAATLYLLPSYVARRRKHPQMAPIMILNIFLGWTFLFWVFSLAWAVANFKNQPGV